MKKIINEKDYNKNINNIKKLISKKDMKLNKVDENKAKTSKIAKQRVKTPFKGEILLKPGELKSEKENKDKNRNETKKSLINTKNKNIKKSNNKIKPKVNTIKVKK